jgi:hypothetical protein
VNQKQEGSGVCGATPLRTSKNEHRNFDAIALCCKDTFAHFCDADPHGAGCLCLNCVGNLLRRIGRGS